MFCPNCRYEYKLGVTTCPDCGADLVYKLPPESAKALKKAEDEKDSVVVYISPDRPSAAIAKSILDEAGIEYFIFDDWRGGHRAAFRVHPDRAEEARELLEGLR